MFKFIRPNGQIDLPLISELLKKPAPFTPGEPLFWDDPYISEQMLAAHLDPTTDLASRRPEVIDACVAWIVDTLGLKPGCSVIDLGCEPGLYALRLAERGMAVTGVDYSRRSIAYARTSAADHHLDIVYRCQDYLTLEVESGFDAALLIFGDYCTFNPEQRKQILNNVHRALKPGGMFIFDVSTPLLHKISDGKNDWSIQQGGFWRRDWHLVLESGFSYPEQKIHLDQFIVVEANGKMSVYRNWFQDYDAGSIQNELTAGGFEVRGFYSDLAGTPFQPDGEWIGILAARAGLPVLLGESGMR